MSRFGEGGPPPEAFRMVPKENPEQKPVAAENPKVDLSEARIVFVRSSGAGGQNVNKRSTKAELHWKVGTAKGFSEEQKAAIRVFAGKLLNADDEIILKDQAERMQGQNRSNVIEKLEQLVADALTPEKERKETRVPRSQKKQRLNDKRHNAERKANRRTDGEW